MASSLTDDPDAQAYQPRSYQLEMFEASLKGNIIVAMGTGSGKTHIALLRIIHELENPHRKKLIWFLAPTVALCFQQHKVISEHIPTAKCKILTGLDKVELWTEQAIWDAVLKDVQLVVSTHAVLADAMTHGFVKISQLGLIIFDEAHHCTGKHPANKIMKNFYHPAIAECGPDAVPRIMGLTASAGSSHVELREIETNLGSICTTPRVHRHELLEHTHRPELHQILFTPVPIEDAQAGSETLKALVEGWATLALNDDPYVKWLTKNSKNEKALQRVLLTGKTYCREQLKTFVDRACHIFEELGQWATDYYVWASAEQLRAKVHDGSIMMDADDEERKFLVDFLSQLPVPNINLHSTDPADFPVSPKLEILISFLESADEEQFSGLIFAQQRATVGVMAHLLSVHPSTKDRFRTAGYVGWSGNGARKDALGELLTAKMQRDTLDDFRDGRKNLIITTDVLEEGIDVSACSVVVCYNKPPNLKSFVQRRGRARRQHSTYAILLSTDDDVCKLHKWHELEKAMEEAYRDDQRRLQELRALENIEEEISERFSVTSTGAVLTADDATQHLYHFCSVLPSQPYVDNRPEFSFETNEMGLVMGKVNLPSSVHPDVRCTEGKGWWLSERAARKEAAFQSYKSLYKFGLVNDNLLPLTKSSEFTQKDVSPPPSMLEASEQYDPWIDWARSWSSPDLYQSRIVVRQNDRADQINMKLMCPGVLPLLEPMTLFWDSETTFTVEIETAERVPRIRVEDVERMRDITALYLQAAMSRRLGPERDFVTLFGPDLAPTEWAGWLQKNGGHEPALAVFSSKRSNDLMGIVRDRSHYDEVLLFKRWVLSDGDPASGLKLECDPFPRRGNLLQQQTLATKRKRCEDSDIFYADRCTIDRLPATGAIFGRFISVIVDRLEAALVATKLCETILRPIGFNDIRHVITAITMPSAQALTNYQRYEFFGDSVLKFTVSNFLFHKNPMWHEGYLSGSRDGLVQNSRLTEEALNRGLDAFIISKTFTPRKWSAPLISKKLQLSTTCGQRLMSSKVLADVVEALIGAAYMDGGLERAQACVRLFLPEVDPDIPMAQDRSRNQPRHIQHESLEKALGYPFNNKTLLLEALTHPSCKHNSKTQCYQRLEFLGDAVLDMVIISTMQKHPVQLPQGTMTQIKHAVINANLLAFFCMDFTWTHETTSTEVDITFSSPSPSTTHTKNPKPKPNLTLKTTSKSQSLTLPHFLRADTTTLPKAREKALTSHAHLRPQIHHSLHHAKTYPWLPLSQLNADKFLSDIVESILGALFIDSGGDLALCEAFLERLGLLRYMRRLLDGGVDVVHPTNRAQVLAGDKSVRFVTRRVQGRDRDGATYTCTATLNLDDTPHYIVVEGCLSKEEAEIKAANEAVEYLRRRVAENECTAS